MQAVSAIIGAQNAPCAVSLDGRVTGAAPAALLLPADGICHIGVHPVTPGFLGVTRMFSFADGAPAACPPDVDAYRWPDGILELAFNCPELPRRSMPRFPSTLARCLFDGAQAVLYEDGGVWLALEQGGRVASGCFVAPAADAGALIPLGRALVALATNDAGAHCVVLDAQHAVSARYEALAAAHGDGTVRLIQDAGGRAGYQRRVTLAAAPDGSVLVQAEEAGRFLPLAVPETDEPADAADRTAPRLQIGSAVPDGCPAALAFLEAVALGLSAEANDMLAPPLRMPAERLSAFLGAYTLARPHPSRAQTFGVGTPDGGVTGLRTFTFETEGNRIVNILAES